MSIRTIIHPDYMRLRPFVEALPATFATSGTVIYSQRNEVRVFDVDGLRLVVKRYKRPNFIQRLTCSLGRPSKGRRAYLYAVRLGELGIDTPRPVASVDCYRGLMYEQGYFVSTEDSRPSCLDLRDGDIPFKAELSAALGQYLVSLHDKGFLHGDTNLSNFLYEPAPDDDAEAFGQTGGGAPRSGSKFRFAVIDVNRSRFVDHPSRELCLRNLVRLTHVRPVLRPVVTAYAEARGWDAAQAYAEVDAHLRHFEQRRKAKRMVRPKRGK